MASEKIDLSSAQSGQFGGGIWFSTLLYSALKQGFTGGFLSKSSSGDAALFVRGGNPVHAAGSAFSSDHIGEMMVRAGFATQSALNDAVDAQAAFEGNKPLIGALLVESGTNPNELKRMVQKQTEIRVLYLLGLEEGQWQSAPGENARIREIGVPTEGWALFLRCLTSGALDSEMRSVADSFLGKAVFVKGGFTPLPGVQLDAEQKALIKYLEKPRKPDQLERALNRKLVRGFLRLMMLEGRLESVPSTQGIPIPKATLMKGAAGYAVPNNEPEPEPEPQQAIQVLPRDVSNKDRVPLARSSSGPRADPKLIKEVEDLHARIQSISLFELLGATDKTAPADLRKLYTAMAKKFHPDLFPKSEEGIAIKAREISAKINEAHQTLTNEKARAEYVALLSDDRIKGNSRTAERIKDSETKFKMGLVMLKKKEYQKAREFFRYAAEGDTTNGEYRAYLAWAMYSDPEFDKDEAMTKGYELIQQALKLQEPTAALHYYAGQFLKAMDKPKDALHQFKAALKIDPKHTEAQRELRLVDMRDKDEKKSGFARLFKR